MKYGITILNTPATIDSDYRGEIKVILVNLSDTDFIVKKGMRIAQMIINAYTVVDFEVTDELSTTVRQDGGFGSTGNFAGNSSNGKL